MVSVTCMGDSRTAGVAVGGWVNRLLTRLEQGVCAAPVPSKYEPWAAGTPASDNLLTGTLFTFYSAGVPGDTTAQMLSRNATDDLGHTSSISIVWGFANDILADASASSIQANIAAIVEADVAAGRSVILVTELPYATGTAPQRATIVAVNAWMRSYASANGHRLVDANALGIPTSDGIHPTAAGYQMVANAFPLSWFGVSVMAGIAAGAKADIRVMPDGRPLDFVARIYGDLGNGNQGVGAGGTLLTPQRPAAYRGYEAATDATHRVNISAANWGDGSAGTLFVVGRAPTTETGLWSWWVSDAERIYMTCSPTAVRGTVLTAAGGKEDVVTIAESGASGVLVAAMRWQTGAQVRALINQTFGTSTNVAAAVTGMPAAKVFPLRHAKFSGDYTGFASRWLFFDRALSDQEMLDTSAAILSGPSPGVGALMLANVI